LDVVDELVGVVAVIKQDGISSDRKPGVRLALQQLDDINPASVGFTFGATSATNFNTQTQDSSVTKTDNNETSDVVGQVRQLAVTNTKSTPETSTAVDLAALEIELRASVVSDEISKESVLDKVLLATEQLHTDQSEYKISTDEPGSSEKSNQYPEVELVAQEETVNMTANKFTPETTKAVDEVSSESVLDKTAQEIKKSVAKIENLPTGVWWTMTFNQGKSPYLELGGQDFESLVFSSELPYVTVDQRAAFMQDLKENKHVDQAAYIAWMDLLPVVQDLEIETVDKTFKEVVDALLSSMIKEGNTQPT